MTPAVPLGHEPVERLEAEWRFRVIYENNLTPTLDNCTFVPFPQNNLCGDSGGLSAHAGTSRSLMTSIIVESLPVLIVV
jgi:hypothetical protein